MEVTKWLKPSESASRIGDRARVCRPKSALNRDGLNVSVGSIASVLGCPLQVRSALNFGHDGAPRLKQSGERNRSPLDFPLAGRQDTLTNYRL